MDDLDYPSQFDNILAIVNQYNHAGQGDSNEPPHVLNPPTLVDPILIINPPNLPTAQVPRGNSSTQPTIPVVNPLNPRPTAQVPRANSSTRPTTTTRTQRAAPSKPRTRLNKETEEALLSSLVEAKEKGH